MLALNYYEKPREGSVLISTVGDCDTFSNGIQEVSQQKFGVLKQGIVLFH